MINNKRLFEDSSLAKVSCLCILHVLALTILDLSERVPMTIIMSMLRLTIKVYSVWIWRQGILKLGGGGIRYYFYSNMHSGLGDPCQKTLE